LSFDEEKSTLLGNMKTPGQNKSRRRGTTLVEVMIGVAILAVLAVAVTTALFYPRHLVVSRAFKQAAIHAGTDALENAFTGPYAGLADGTVSLGDLSAQYNINGRTVTGDVTVVTVPGGPSDLFNEYKRIAVAVAYPGGDTPVVLTTSRSP